MKVTFSALNGFSSGLNWVLNRNIIRFFSSFNLALCPSSSSEDEMPIFHCPNSYSSNFVDNERIERCLDRYYNVPNSNFPSASIPKCVAFENDEMEIMKTILASKGWFFGHFERGLVDEDSVITVLIGLYDDTRNAAVSLCFFRWLEASLGLKHTIKSVCTLIQILVLGNMNYRVVDLLRSIVHNQLQPEELVKVLQQICLRKVLEIVYSMLVYCYIKENMIDEALQVICLIEKLGIFPSMTTCNSLIKSLLNLDKEQLAWDFFEELQRRGLVYTATINLFIYFYGSKGNLECGWKLLTSMDNYGIKPDVIAYATFIHFLCKMCYLREATCLVFKLIQKCIFPDSVMLSSIIDGYCRVGRPGDAFLVIKFFKLVPNIYVFNSFISQLCKDGDMQKASAIFKEIKDFQMCPDCFSYTTMINGYCKANNVRKALEYLGRMLKGGIEPSIVTYTVLIDSHCRIGDMNTARHMIKDMTREGLIPDIVLYNTLINCYSYTGNLQKAYELLDMMKSVGVSPDVVTYNTIIHGLVMKGCISEANDMLDELTRRGFCLNVVGFTDVIGGYSRKGHFVDAFLVWSFMTEHGIAPDVVTCSALISGYCRACRMDEALALFQKMVGAGMIPDLIMYNTLIHGFCKLGKLDRAFHLINLMLEDNIIPDDVTCKALILGYEKNHVYNPAKRAVYKIQQILHRHGANVNQLYHS